jgi:hypothetical protein
MMSLGDFSSVVQLGVGLHAGTALLQSISQLASAPLSRELGRLKSIAEVRSMKRDDEEHLETARDLVGDLEIKKVQFFNEYREIVAINSAIAVGLGVVLAIIAFCAEYKDPPLWLEWLIVVGSLVPAPASILFLWNRWQAHTQGLRDSIDDLRSAMLT